MECKELQCLLGLLVMACVWPSVVVGHQQGRPVGWFVGIVCHTCGCCCLHIIRIGVASS
jgi:hypothetical protein